MKNIRSATVNKTNTLHHALTHLNRALDLLKTRQTERPEGFGTNIEDNEVFNECMELIMKGLDDIPKNCTDSQVRKNHEHTVIGILKQKFTRNSNIATMSGEDGATLLMYSVASGMAYVVDFMLTLDSRVEKEDDHGNSAVSYLLNHNVDDVDMHVQLILRLLHLRNAFTERFLSKIKESRSWKFRDESWSLDVLEEVMKSDST